MDLGRRHRPGPSHGPLPPAYADGSWMDLASFESSAHLSPAHEYTGFDDVPASPPNQSMNSSTETTLSQIHPPLRPMQALRPLVVPPWPSTLTGLSSFATPILPTPPSSTVTKVSSSTASLSAPISAVSNRSIRSNSTPRRTLTDTDRRRMCRYHEEHPTVKQTEIGALFGVERSTVSKVLRHKEKYLFPDEGRRSPMRPSKGRFPDLERALSNWARNTQRSGRPVSDEMIREKARFFANTVGGSENDATINGRTWLEKFRQRNHLTTVNQPHQHPHQHPHQLNRSGPDGSDVDARRPSQTSPTLSQTPGQMSPASPTNIWSHSPLTSSGSREDLKTDAVADGHTDWTHGYRLYHSQSATSLSSVFSAEPTSPTSPYFATNPAGHFSSAAHGGLPPSSQHEYPRLRSRTVPHLGLDPAYVGLGIAPDDDLTPRFATAVKPSRTSSPLADSPLSEMGPPPPPPPPPPSISSGHGQAASTASADGFGRASRLGSPTSEDARRALEVVMAFIQHQPSGVVDPQEFMTMCKLMEKLQVHGSAASGRGGAGLDGLGGLLPQIPEANEVGGFTTTRIEQSASI